MSEDKKPTEPGRGDVEQIDPPGCPGIIEDAEPVGNPYDDEGEP